MRHSIRTTALAVSAALLSLAPYVAGAQATLGVDPRWYPWLGCWAPDSAAATGSPTTTCFVPVTGERAIDLLTFEGTVITRTRIETAGGPHAIDNQGCAGTETITWSETGRRAFFQSTYTCAGNIKGTATTVYAFLPGGKALRVEQVRSGNGSIATIARLQPARIPSGVPAAAARAIEGQQRSITTARASAAIPITIDEVIDAVHKIDADAVKSWVLASEQPLSLNGEQLTALIKSGVPGPVLRAVMGADAAPPSGRVFAETVYSGPYGGGGYSMPMYNAPAYGAYPSNMYQQQVTTVNACPPEGCAPQYASPYYNGFGFGYPFASPFFSGFPAVVVRTERPAPIFGIRRGTPVVSQPVGRGPGGRRP